MTDFLSGYIVPPGAGVAGDFTYISTAGGAFLEWLEGKPLPGVEVLKKR